MTILRHESLTDAVLRPIGGHHAFEACVEQLATAIRLGVYPHGSSLPPERELAERLTVSRATLREAIAALRAAGLVETRRGRGGGTVVKHLPSAPGVNDIDIADRLDELRDTLVFRRVVEPGGCHIAAGRTLTAADQNLLTEALDEVCAATDPAGHRQADSRFHLAIATLSASPLTVRAVTEVQSRLHELLGAIPVMDRNITHSDTQHQSIAEAILDGNPTKARLVMERHCDDTAALLRGLLG